MTGQSVICPSMTMTGLGIDKNLAKRAMTFEESSCRLGVGHAS
jgi:hypothetical protein